MKPPADPTKISGHVEPSPHDKHPRVIDGPNGPVVAATGTTIADKDVRASLETARERSQLPDQDRKARRAREELAGWIRTGSGPQVDLAASEQVKRPKL